MNAQFLGKIEINSSVGIIIYSDNNKIILFMEVIYIT
jgi:hypothetical protein